MSHIEDAYAVSAGVEKLIGNQITSENYKDFKKSSTILAKLRELTLHGALYSLLPREVERIYDEIVKSHFDSQSAEYVIRYEILKLIDSQEINENNYKDLKVASAVITKCLKNEKVKNSSYWTRVKVRCFYDIIVKLEFELDDEEEDDVEENPKPVANDTRPSIAFKLSHPDPPRETHSISQSDYQLMTTYIDNAFITDELYWFETNKRRQKLFQMFRFRYDNISTFTFEEFDAVINKRFPSRFIVSEHNDPTIYFKALAKRFPDILKHEDAKYEDFKPSRYLKLFSADGYGENPIIKIGVIGIGEKCSICGSSEHYVWWEQEHDNQFYEEISYLAFKWLLCISGKACDNAILLKAFQLCIEWFEDWDKLLSRLNKCETVEQLKEIIDKFEVDEQAIEKMYLLDHGGFVWETEEDAEHVIELMDIYFRIREIEDKEYSQCVVPSKPDDWKNFEMPKSMDDRDDFYPNLTSFNLIALEFVRVWLKITNNPIIPNWVFKTFKREDD